MMIKQQKINVLNKEHLVREEHTVSLCIWSVVLVFFPRMLYIIVPLIPWVK